MDVIQWWCVKEETPEVGDAGSQTQSRKAAEYKKNTMK